MKNFFIFIGILTVTMINWSFFIIGMPIMSIDFRNLLWNNGYYFAYYYLYILWTVVFILTVSFTSYLYNKYKIKK
jgi:hypothetical protein